MRESRRRLREVVNKTRMRSAGTVVFFWSVGRPGAETTAGGKRREVDKQKPLFIQVGRRLVLFHAARQRGPRAWEGAWATPLPCPGSEKQKRQGPLIVFFNYTRIIPSQKPSRSTGPSAGSGQFPHLFIYTRSAELPA